MEQPRIQLYFHCKNCKSGQLAAGWTTEGIQVYCEKCHLNVIDIDFEGKQLPTYKGKYEEL